MFWWHPKQRVKFCSQPCFKKSLGAGLSTKVPWAECPTCGKHYIRRKSQTYCGKACYPKKPKPPPQPRMVSCFYCKAQWLSLPSIGSYACAPCREAALKESRRNAAQNRKARKRDAFVERVYRKRIFERDGWKCQLCGRAVRREALVPDPLAPTLDHILPLSAGGKHEPKNVQCAHFMCNSIKGNRSQGEQLRLVG